MRTEFVKMDHLDCVKLMETLADKHMRRQVATLLRDLHLEGGDLPTRMFNLITNGLREEAFTNTASGGFAFLVNGDARGSVHTEEQSEEGTKPDNILKRTLPNGRRTSTVVENKLAKPKEPNEVVPRARIRSKMREAVRNLRRYYHTYKSEADAFLAVVYAPSSAKPEGEQFEWRRAGKNLGGKPCYEIVIRIDLGGK